MDGIEVRDNIEDADCISVSEQQKLQDEIARINLLSQNPDNADIADNANYVCEVEEESEESESDNENDEKDDLTAESTEVYVPLDFKDLAVDLDGCILMNGVYQEFIKRCIQRLEVCLIDNQEKQKTVQEELDQMAKRKKRACGNRKIERANTIFCVPYFKDKKGFAQPLNEDTKDKLLSEDPDPYVKPANSWLANDRAILRKAVRIDSLEEFLQRLMNKKELLQQKIESDDYKINEKDDFKKKLQDIEDEMELVKKKDEKLLYGSRWDKHDWMKISVMSFDGFRKPRECELWWKNYEHPDVNKDKWSSSEDSTLKHLVSIHGNDWDVIAKSLMTNRTPQQCIERYQSELNENFLKSKWTPEEDAALIKIIESCRIGDYIPWHQVMYYLDGRIRSQVAKHWYDTLNPAVIKGHWNESEDMMLLTGIARFGENRWAQIQQHIPGRTASQCRDRWLNCLSSTLSFRPWTEAEEAILIKSVSEYGPKWSQIALFLPGRTDSMVAKRYQLIMSYTNVNKEDDFPSSSATNTDMTQFTRPRTCGCRKARQYRSHIYKKLLNSLDKIYEKRRKVEPKKSKESYFAKFLLTNEKDLDRLIYCLKQKYFAQKINEIPTGRPKITHSPEDMALMEYFKFTNIKRGRPFTQRVIEDTDPEMIFAIKHYSQVMKRKFSFLNTLEMNNGITRENTPMELPGLPNSALLPPTLASLTGFKNLLLCRKHLVESVKKMMTPQEVQENSDAIVKTHGNACGSSKSINFVNKPAGARQGQLHEELKIPDDDYFPDLLHRFISIFFWPALLSTVKPNLEKNTVYKEKRENNRSGMKRKKKKPWVAETMRKKAKKSKTNANTSEVPINEDPTVEKKNKGGRPKGSKRQRVVIEEDCRRSNRIRRTTQDTDKKGT